MKHHAILIAPLLWCLALDAGSQAQTTPALLQSSALDPSRDTTLYTIGYSHLDTQWRWDYQTTIRTYIPNTMRENFLLFEKYPGYVFNFSGANRYRMMKEYYPADYQRLKDYVIANRWFPCGSSMEETDALVPSAESLVRNILYGNNFFRREFGKASNEYLVPDCFGFPASMPSIFAHCGVKGFSTQKLTWGSAVGIPFNNGLWVGPDGASVIAALNPGDYVTLVKEDLSASTAWLRRISESGKRSGIVAEFMYYGTGDVGGSPAEESVQWIEKSMAGPGPIHVLSVPASQFFDDLTPEKQTGLPRYTGELLLTNHSAGSLSSQAYMKRWNRKNELLAYAAEASSVMADWLGGTPYPGEKLSEAWRLVLGAQFHDILAGTCIPRAYEYSWNDEVLALNQFGAATADAVGAIVRGLNTESTGVPLVVFNPIPAHRQDIVEATINTPPGALPEVRIYGPDGKEVPSQILRKEGNQRTVAFLATLPSLGFGVYDVRPSKTGCRMATGLQISRQSVENSRYRVTIDAGGDVSAIFDKQAAREILSAPIRLEFLHERPLEYPAWNMDWNDRKQPPTGFVDGSPSVRMVESGPARVALEIDREARGSRFIQRIRLSAGESGERVEFYTRIHWFTPETSLKARFPLTVSNAVATYNTGAGSIERGNNNEKKFEVPSHQWLDLTDRGGAYGVSVLEDSKFGSDKPADDVLRLTLLFTPGVRGGYRDQATQDFGVHEMLYALVGHQGDWRGSSALWQGARLNQSLIAFQTTSHKGFLGSSISFLQTSSPDVAVVALKKAENSGEIILRLQETTGSPARNVHVKFAADILSAREVDGQERPIGGATLNSGEITCTLSPYQLRAFAVTLRKAPRALGFPLCQPLPLSYDTDVISSNTAKADGRFDESGAALPGEMLPDSIVSEGILFTLGPKSDGANNALTCNGQSLQLPGGNLNRLYLLAASAGADTQISFSVDAKPLIAPVGQWSGFVGQWDNRLWDGYQPQERDYSWDNIVYEGLTPGYVKRGTVAYVATHRHLPDGLDDPYAYAYLYKLALTLPRGARIITLPVNHQVKILAMTAALNENDATFPATALYDTLNLAGGDYARFQMTPRPRCTPDNCILGGDTPGEITITSKDAGAEIFYTLDGTEPTRNSIRYTGPVRLERTTTLKAVAFESGKHPSLASAATYYHAFRIARATYLSSYAAKYRGRGDSTLIDGIRGTTSFSGPAWQGFEGEDLSVVLDLGRTRTVRSVTLGCLSDHGSWIFLPASMTVALSEDGKAYGPEARHDFPAPASSEETGVRDLSVTTGGVQGRYVRVTARNIGRCPAWHPGAGGKAWMFADEIIVE
jgi:alpha-mannosidase